MSKEEDEDEPLDIPGDDYYQNMLKTLDGPLKGQKYQSFTIQKPTNQYDASSPFFYLNSIRALSSLEAKVNAQKQLEKNMETSKREETRAKNLSEKQAQAKRPASNKGVIKSILAMKISSSSIKERLLEDELLRPYRKEPRNVKKLMEHCREIIHERNQEIERKNANRVPRIPLQDQPTLEERIESARIKREEIDEEYRERLEIITLKNAVEKQPQRNTRNRTKMWLSISQYFFMLNKVAHVVHETRCIKNQDKTKWNACIKIQRLWRKRRGHSLKDRDREVTNVSQKLRASLGNNDGRIVLFKARTVSADLIIQFLKDTRTSACMRKMFRVVKFIQRLSRSLRGIDNGRIHLLQLYIERCMMPLAAHIAIVANNRGLDLDNLSHFEINQLRAQSHLVKNYRVIANMHTPEFHALLRKHISKLTDYQKDFIASKTWTERSDIRRKLLLQLLTKKRKQFLKDLHKPSPMTFTIPQMSVEEIQAFMLGGPDPLTPRLMQYEAQHQQWYEEKHRPKTPFRCTHEENKSLFVLPRFSLYKYLQPGDLIRLFAEFSQLLREERRLAAAHLKMAALASIEAEKNNAVRSQQLSMTNFEAGNVLQSFASSSIPFGRPGMKERMSHTFHHLGESSSHYNSNNNYSNRLSRRDSQRPFSSSSSSSRRASTTLGHKSQYNQHINNINSSATDHGFSPMKPSLQDRRAHKMVLQEVSSSRPSASTAESPMPPPMDRKKSVSMQRTHRKLVF